MARLPSANDLSRPASLRSGRAIAAADTSAIGRGLQSFGASVTQIGDDLARQQNAVDLARAEAFKTQRFLEIENEFANDPDYATAAERAAAKTQEVVGNASGLIRDPSLRERWSLGAGTDAAAVNDAVYDRGVTLRRQAETEAFTDALEANRRIYVDPATPEALRTKARADIEGAIAVGLDTGLLTPSQADELRGTYLEDADYSRGLLAVENGQFDGPVPSIPEGSSQEGAAALLRQFEGFRSTPYWDVNANRVGYGSDTITRPDGTVVRVTANMAVTREDAERDLARRVVEFQQQAASDVGQEAWDRLPSHVQAALTSVTYNYGNVPARIRGAVQSGDPNRIADAVAGLQADNGGVNRERRLKEAAIIRGQGNPDWYTRLSPEQQSIINAKQTERREALAAAEAEQRKVAYTLHKDQVELGILTGSVVSEQEILGDSELLPGDQAALLRTLRSEQGATANARNYLQGLSDGTAQPLNPYNSDDRALADKAYEMAVSAVPEDQRGAATAIFVEESGIVPKRVVADVRQSINSNDVATVAVGLQQSAALLNAAPQALANVENGKELLDSAATYRELVNNQGLTAEQAAQRVIEMRDPANVARAEQLDKAWDQAVRDNRFTAGDVTSAFSGSPFGSPVAGMTPAQEAGMTADYLEAAERAFKGSAQGNIDVARAIAIEEMKRTYGVSQTSGQPVVMKYPPENFYPEINGSKTYIRDLAFADARSLAPDASNVMLIPTPETSLDIRSGQPPRYNLMYQLPDGRWDMAAGMFMVDTESISALDTLASEERAVRFQIERQFQEAIAERREQGLPPAGAIEEIDPALRERLLDIETRRRTLLGSDTQQAAPGGSDPAQLDAERIWLEQLSETFGAFGGSGPQPRPEVTP